MSIVLLAERLGARTQNQLHMHLGYSVAACEAPCGCGVLEENFLNSGQTTTKILACSQEHAELANELVEKEGDSHTIEIFKGWDEQGALLPRSPGPPSGFITQIV